MSGRIIYIKTQGFPTLLSTFYDKNMISIDQDKGEVNLVPGALPALSDCLVVCVWRDWL